jgi:hypothetical protein
MVITIEDAKWMASPANMVPELARLIVDKLPDIRTRSESIPAIQRTGFARNTLLILSNVLLDNWQIRNVEKEFLKTERPLRNGRRYYYALFEKPASQRSEAFGIYGNAVGSVDGIALNMYGKQRYDGNTLLSISDADFKKLFGLSPQEDIRAEAKVLLERLVLLARTGENRLDAREKDGLSALGLFENGVLHVTVLHPSEAESLHSVAALLTPNLLSLLERHRSELESIYRRSPYRDEVTFSEFFIWWYHFYYTAVTNRLAQGGFIDIPHSGNTTYVVAG